MKFSKANEDAQMYAIQFTSHFPKNGERLGWIIDGIKATTNIPTRRVSTYRENSKAFPLTTHHRKFLFYLISWNSILAIFPDIIFFSDIFLLKKPKLNLFQDLNQLLHALRYFRLIVLILPEPGSRRGGLIPRALPLDQTWLFFIDGPVFHFLTGWLFFNETHVAFYH